MLESNLNLLTMNHKINWFKSLISTKNNIMELKKKNMKISKMMMKLMKKI